MLRLRIRHVVVRLLATAVFALSVTGARAEVRLFVDAVLGDDTAPGTREGPFRSVSAALALVPDGLRESVTIEMAPGEYRDTGSVAMAPDSLFLSRRMAQGGAVHIVGRTGPAGEVPVLAWEGGPCMVDVREGEWSLEGVRIGTFTTRQRRGVSATGPGRITLRDVSCRLRSLSDAAVYASRGGEVALAGQIALNEDLHEAAGAETFSGIVADDHGMVRFVEREGASLDIGNGSLSASYYGCIQLGCQRARVTSWTEQSNCLAVNNSGRIDLHGTETTLCAWNPRNTPIGLEDDGHILAEGAHLVIEGQGNGDAIVLQKASTLFCNDIEILGEVGTAVSAMSGSVCVTGFLGDVQAITATTGAHISVESVGGTLRGPVRASRGASIDLPDGTVVRD
jgi:hypothetical protein